MWGYSEEVPHHLMQFHLGLSNQLASLSWSRIQLWNANVSVHEWTIDSKSYSIDAKVDANKVILLLVSRDPQQLSKIIKGLELEGVNFQPVPGRNDRVQLADFAEYSNPLVIEQVANLIRSTRNAIALTIQKVFTFHDNFTGLNIHYSVKPERKNNDQLIFIYTSIRSKPHWLDFNGPLGDSLQNLRARVVFVFDDAGSNFTYNFSHNGKLDVMKSNISFIKDYVTDNGYSWNKVTLAGLSKGGTSALLLGAQLPSCSMVALAPQLNLGNYLLRSNRHEIIYEMSGLNGDAGATLLDDMMWQTLRASLGKGGSKGCYILTSPNDVDCYAGLGRFRTLISAHNNVTLEAYVDNSPFTTTHLKTVHHLTPTFLSILGLLASGMRPKSMELC